MENKDPLLNFFSVPEKSVNNFFKFPMIQFLS